MTEYIGILAASFGARYIADRRLPDSALDLLDEAASALRLAQESKPDELDALDRELITMQIELESLKKETDVFSTERRESLNRAIEEKKRRAQEVSDRWQIGKQSFNEISYDAFANPLCLKQRKLGLTLLRTSNSAWRILNTFSTWRNARVDTRKLHDLDSQ